MRSIKSLIFAIFLIWILVVFAVSSAQQSPTQFTGLIDDDTPFVEIAFAVDAATTVTIDLDAVSGDLDTYLYLVDGSGKILAENDDRVRGNTNSSIREFFIPTGDYTVIASRYGVNRGDTVGEYQLNITYNAQTTERLVYDVSQPVLADKGFPELAPKPKAEWTVLVYYGGDSTLETSLMSDFVEFERAGGSTENTRIVALLDRYGLSDANGAWTGARLFEIMPNTTGDFGTVPVPTMDSIPLADLGDTDTGNGETLAQFLTWGMMNYPAEHYVVAFGGHGGGWRGVITDDTSKTIITLPELDEALRVAKTAVGIDQFDLVLNDACLMSSVEYYDVVSRHVEYALASPEIVIDPALDMTLLVELIQGDFDIDKLGEPLVNTYIERDIFVKQRPDSRYMTFASSQLDEMADLRRTIESFARVVNQNPLTYAPLLGQARSNAYTYAKFLGGDNDNDVDLGHFMRQIIAYSGDANIINPARDVLRALENVRLYGNAADYARLYTSYYSIYFPAKSKDFNPAYFNETPLKQWAEMLANYYNSTSPRLWSRTDSVLTYHPPLAPEVKITTAYPEVANIQNPPVLGLEVVGRGLSQGQFTVDQITENGDKIRLMSTPILTEVTVGGTETEYVNTWKSGLDLSYFNWQPFTLSVVTDGQVANNELIIKSRDIGTLAGRFRIPNSENWVEVAVIFNPLGYVEQVIGRADVVGVVAPITIPRGAEFQAYRYVVMPDGDVKPEAGNMYTWGENGIAYVEQTVPAGEYELGFLVKTFSGTNGFASSPLTVVSPDANRAEFVGYTDVELGITFQHPASWRTVSDRGDILYTYAPNEDSEIVVYAFPMTDSVYDILNIFTTAYDAQLFASARPLSLFDTPALQFDVVWSERPGWRGRGIALYKETARGGMGMIFVANGTDTETIFATFNGLRDGIRLFDTPVSSASWAYNTFPNGLAYPVPTSWTRADVDDWRVYADSTSPDTQVAIARLKADNARALLDELVAGYPSATDVQLRDYFAEYRTWHVAGFTADNLAMRIYVARIDNRVYAVRTQTPLGDSAAGVYRTIFEPIVDGFAPRLTVILSSGGLLSTYTKATLVNAQKACGTLSFDTVCAGNGTVNTTYADDSTAKTDFTALNRAVTPVQNQVTITTLAGLRRVDVGLLGDGTIDPLSVALLNLQTNLSNNATGGLLMVVFGGITVENKSTDGVNNNFEISLNGAPNDPNLVNGVLLIAPRDMATFITINGVEFELAPNAIMFWREANQDIENASIESDRVGVVGLVAKRLPGSWSTDVLKGILRARVRGSFGQLIATTVAGSTITYADETLSLDVNTFDKGGLVGNLISANPDIIIIAPLTNEQLQDIIDLQDLLNEVDLNNDDIVLGELIIVDGVLANPTPEITLTEEPILPLPIITEAPIVTPEPPIITPEPPIPPTYGLTAPDVSCVEGDLTLAFVTYTSSDGATLVNVTVTSAVSSSVNAISSNQAEIQFFCPFPDGYTMTVDGVDSLGRTVSVTFNINASFAGATFTIADTFCYQGETVNVVGELVGSDIDFMVPDSFIISDTNVAVQANVETVSGGFIYVPISCLMTGSVTVSMTVEDLDTNQFSDTANINVSPPPPPAGTLSVSDASCLSASSTTVNVGYTNPMFPDRTISSVTNTSSSNPDVVIVGNSFVPGPNVYGFTLAINCNAVGTSTITVDILDSNGDAYSDTGIVTVDPATASPPYFSGMTNITCEQGQQYDMQFEYIENEPGTPTLTGASASAGGAVSVQAGNISLINGRWVRVFVDCNTVGSGTVDVFATTSSGLYPNVSVTGINFTVNPPVAGTPYIIAPAPVTCTVGQTPSATFTYYPNGGEALFGIASMSIDPPVGVVSNISSGTAGDFITINFSCDAPGVAVWGIVVSTTPSFQAVTAPDLTITVNNP